MASREREKERENDDPSPPHDRLFFFFLLPPILSFRELEARVMASVAEAFVVGCGGGGSGFC